MFQELSNLGSGGMDSFFGDFFGRMQFPRMDLEENENNFVVNLEMPGIDPKDIEIELQNNYLLVHGKTESKKESKDKHFHMQERRYGSFSRQIMLPDQVDEKAIKAKVKDGLLSITLPKKNKEVSTVKKIPIEA